MFISVADPQVLNACIDEAKEEGVKVQEKYTALLKARGVKILCHQIYSGLILGLCTANERRRYKVTPSLIQKVGWAQT